MSSGRTNGHRPRVQTGDILLIQFPVHWPPGHEQQGARPAVVVGLPWEIGTPRFNIVIVAPLTRDRRQHWLVQNRSLYPRLSRGTAGLRSPSICLLDQIRAVDVERVIRYFGRLTAEQYEPIQSGMRQMMLLSRD